VQPIASATKLMTAFIALRELRPSDEVTAPDYAAGAAESLMGLEAGEVASVRDLLYGLLVASGNDAASALAIRVSGSEPDFVAAMNATAARLGLDDTTYTDPIGLDGGNVSSARDLIDLTIRLRREPLFRKIVDTPRITLGAGPDRHRLTNRNTLVLEEPFVDGVKTGTTLAAGYVLVASGERKSVELVSALLGAPGEEPRDEATLELLDYGHALYRARALVTEGERIASLALGDGRGRLPLVAAGPVMAVARADQETEVRYEPPAPPGGAVTRGQGFGTATVLLDGREAGEVAVVAARDVAAPPDEGLPTWAWIVFAGAGAVAFALVTAAVVVARRPSR
jgi:D-alanyl-D-alanine carboxypeptidase